MTLRNHIEDVEDAARSGPSHQLDFSQSTGNSINNSKAVVRQHTLQEKAPKNIDLINKNHTLETTLFDTQCYKPYYGTWDMCTKAWYKYQYVQGTWIPLYVQDGRECTHCR
jgi:hypothetical protein